MTQAATTDDGYTWIEKEVTRKGKTHKQWFRIKVKGAASAKKKGAAAKLVEAQPPKVNPEAVVAKKALGFGELPPAPKDYWDKHFGMKPPSAAPPNVAEKLMAAQPKPPEAASPESAAQNILGKKLTGPLGSNPGGTYLGKDGVERYVKFYAAPEQAASEKLTNAIYQDLHQLVPQTQLFQHEGKAAIASDLIEGKPLKDALTPDVARDFLKGFAADVLTANWDAAGLTMDNSLVRNEAAYRIDNGGALLRRASGKLKPAEVLNAIPEWEGFFNPQKNPTYSKVALTAGVTKAEQLGNSLREDLKGIQKLEARHGGWDGYIKQTVPELDAFPAERAKIVGMLTARTRLMAEKIDAIPPGDPGVGFKYVQREVTRKGKTHKQWFKVKDAEVSVLMKTGKLKKFKGPPPSHEEMRVAIDAAKLALKDDKYEAGAGLSSAQHSALIKRGDAIVAKMSFEQKQALQAFVGSSYGMLRRVQSGQTFEQFIHEKQGTGKLGAGAIAMDKELWDKAQATLPHLAAAQEAMTITDPTQHGTLHRGMNVSRETLHEMLSGDAITHDGYGTNSTSYSRGVSVGFSTPESSEHKKGLAYAFNPKKEYPVLIKYTKVKTGANFMWSNGTSHEQEVALGKGVFKIVGRKYVTGAHSPHPYFEFEVEQTE